MTLGIKFMIVNTPNVYSLHEISDDTMNLSLKDANLHFRMSKLGNQNFTKR
jgi:hypothetical protein